MQKLPVGLSDFKQVIEGNYYYVDKSLLLKELIDQGAPAMLIPRPRRFGKTLNLSMLRYFFEKTEQDNSHLFRHLKIWQAGEEYTSRQGKYPAIFLTFKDVKESNWESALKKIKQLIQEEFLRHKYLRAERVLEVEELEYFNRIAQLTTDQSAYENSLKNLSRYLTRHHNQRVILLIDEYDTPIQAGYINGYYAEVVGFMRNFLSAGLKDNSALEKGVVTGILRVAKESIFSGLNNLDVYTLLSHSFSDKFGLTEEEIKRLLEDLNLQNHYEEVRTWYNGYQFGSHIIYNPWSIISYANKPRDGFKPYWVNTADNAIVEKLLTRGGKELKGELDNLIAGESVEKPIEENMVFGEIERREDLLWSFLLFGGYLKYTGTRADDHDPSQLLAWLSIPNMEVRGVFIRLVKNWFRQRLDDQKLEEMLHALRAGDIPRFEHFFRYLVVTIFSYHDFADESEKVYQAFVIGLFVWLGGEYELKSDRESGYGRYDLMIIPKDKTQVGYVIEFKKVSDYENETVELAIAKAFAQIETKNYEMELRARGVTAIKKLAIVFQGKEVWVREQIAESRERTVQ